MYPLLLLQRKENNLTFVAHLEIFMHVFVKKDDCTVNVNIVNCIMYAHLTKQILGNIYHKFKLTVLLI